MTEQGPSPHSIGFLSLSEEACKRASGSHSGCGRQGEGKFIWRRSAPNAAPETRIDSRLLAVRQQLARSRLIPHGAFHRP